MNYISEHSSLLSAVFKSAINGLIVINEQGIIKMVNPVVAKLFGYTETELIGNNIHILMGVPHKALHNAYLSKYITSGIKKIIGLEREVKGKRKDGTQFSFRLSISEAFVDGERFFSGLIQNIAESKTANEDLKNINAQLEQLVQEQTKKLSDTVNQFLQTKQDLEKTYHNLELALQKEKELGELKSRFVSLASHEFRTPLSTILSSANIIEKYGVTDKQVKHTKRIQSSVKNLTNILNDFLSIGKLEEGKTIVKPEHFDLLELLHDLVDELIEIKKKDQYFNLEFRKNECALYTDMNLLRNILINVISNACKYSGKGEIKIKLAQHANTVTLSVVDKGIGIPEKEQRFLFDRFFRAQNTSNIQGTGLGLNIVKNYVHLLNGNISFVSKEDEGTTFSIQFPKQLKI